MKSHYRDNNSIASTSTTATNTTIGNLDEEKGTPKKKLEANASMCYHCFDVLVDELLGKNSNNNSSNHHNNRHHHHLTHHHKRSSTTDFVSTLPTRDVSCPLFVTWDKCRSTTNSSSNKKNNKQQQQQSNNNNNYDLRGCIGTLSPKRLETSIGEYALTSALRDKRFHPVIWAELPLLRVAVSLLVQYEECDSVHDWTIGLHGILIRFSVISTSTSSSRRSNISNNNNSNNKEREYSATYLPEVASEQGWDQITTITSLIKKAGYHGPVTSHLLQQVHCTRYQSSKHRITFQEYMQYRGYYDEEQQQEEIRHNNNNNNNNKQQSSSPSTEGNTRRTTTTSLAEMNNVSTSHHHSSGSSSGNYLVNNDDNNNYNNDMKMITSPPKWNTCNFM